jgi:hypothetical protein
MYRNIRYEYATSVKYQCNLESVYFSFSSLFYISLLEIQKLDGSKNEKLRS